MGHVDAVHLTGDTLNSATNKQSTKHVMLPIICCAKTKVLHRQPLPDWGRTPADLSWLMLERMTHNTAFDA